MAPSAACSEKTRHDLIAAAGPLFASQGLEGATVRDICAKAGTSIAAVNYHFQGKTGLYLAVFRDFLEHVEKRYPLIPSLPDQAPIRRRLHAIVHSLLLRMLGHERSAVFFGLMMREMNQPTVALDLVIRHMTLPLFVHIGGLVREILGPQADDATVRCCVASVLGQCAVYRHMQPLIHRLDPSMKYDAATIERLADHITDFSLSAMRAMVRRSSGGRSAGKRKAGR